MDEAAAARRPRRTPRPTPRRTRTASSRTSRPWPRRGGRAGRRVVHPEPGAGPPEARHDLVRDEQHAVVAAHVRDALPVALGRLDGGQRRPDDRLADERAHRAGLRRRDRRSSSSTSSCVVPAPAARVPAAVRVGRADVPEPAEPALVWPAERAAAGQVERAQRVAVVAAPAREHDPAVARRRGRAGRAGELERGLDRLRAAATPGRSPDRRPAGAARARPRTARAPRS